MLLPVATIALTFGALTVNAAASTAQAVNPFKFSLPSWDTFKESLNNFVLGSMQSWYEFIGDLYETMINVILYTPAEIIANDHIRNLWWIFVGITASLLSSVAVIEGIRIIAGKSKTNLIELCGRTAAAFTALGVIIPGMTYGIKLMNAFIANLVDIAHNHMGVGEYFSSTLAQTLGGGAVNMFASTIFIGLFIFYMFKILLRAGRRWFDIMVSVIVSPLAFASLIFDSTAKYFKMWGAHVTNLYLVQIVQAIYVSVIALVLLSPGLMGSVGDGVIQILLITGALWRLSSPPAFVVAQTASPDSRSMVRDIARQFRRMKGKGKGEKPSE